MGFNIEAFFEELFILLNDTEMDEIDKLDALEKCIYEAANYFEECR